MEIPLLALSIGTLRRLAINVIKRSGWKYDSGEPPSPDPLPPRPEPGPETPSQKVLNIFNNGTTDSYNTNCFDTMIDKVCLIKNTIVGLCTQVD